MVDVPQDTAQPSNLHRRLFNALPGRCCDDDPYCPYDWYDAGILRDLVHEWLEQLLLQHAEHIAQVAAEPLRFVPVKHGEYVYEATSRAVRFEILRLATEDGGNA